MNGATDAQLVLTEIVVAAIVAVFAIFGITLYATVRFLVRHR